MNKALKAARAKVNALEFGTEAWEAAMVVVRTLVDAEMTAAPKEPYISHEGDVFSV